jgi:O-antigen ligase
LWTAGLAVIREHWLVGIGYGGWRDQMLQRLHYPYSSPHNALLHLWGTLGLAGVLLMLGAYCRILVVIVRKLKTTSARAGMGIQAPLGIAPILLMLMAHELVDGALIFSLSRLGLLAWILIGILAESVGDCGFQRHQVLSIVFAKKKP